MADLPPWLARAVDAELEGRARSELAGRSARISAAYRAGRGSREAVGSDADAIAYAVARMPATHAGAARVFAEIRDLVPEWAPRAVLDCGSGPGTAGFAALETWPTIERLRQEDRNPAFLQLAGRFAAAAGADRPFALEQEAVDLGRAAAPDPGGRFDLALLGYVLAEFDVRGAAALAARIFERTGGALAIVEPGTPDGTARVLAARDRLLALGARVLAPCPHEGPCPLLPPDWCHFSERLARRRAHIAAKAATLPFEDERFAYLVAVREPLFRRTGEARIVAPPAASKAAIRFRLCRPDGTAAEASVARRDRPRFAAARRLGWGDRIED